MCFCEKSTFFNLEEDKHIFKDLLTNYEIREREVRLIDENGTQLGIVPTPKAMSIADEKNLDLVMISPQANPPVCKLMNYSKYRFDQIKREKEERKNRKNIEVKDIWLSATIDVGDIEIKAKKAREFIEEGHKVKLSIRMRGRQQAHPEVSIKVMDNFFEKVKDVAQIEKKPLQDGRSIIMVIAPVIKK